MVSMQQTANAEATDALQQLTKDVLEMSPSMRCWLVRRTVRCEPEASFEVSWLVGQYRALVDAYLYHKHCSTLTPLLPDAYPELREQLIEIAGADTAEALTVALAEFLRLLSRL